MDGVIPASTGTNQAQRGPRALDPASAPLDGRSPGQLATAARDFASTLAFWTSQNRFEPSVNWADFLPDVEGKGSKAAVAEAENSPQKALFLAFLHLYGFAQAELNKIPERHLRHQYETVLKLRKHPARGDRAHLILSNKKSLTETRVPIGTKFSTENSLIYESTQEIFVRQLTLAHIRTIHRDPVTSKISAAPIANSEDGMGSDFSDEDQSWHPFGHNRELPAADYGFALSSPILLLKEGERTIKVFITLDFTGAAPLDSKLKNFFRTGLKASLSGEEEWIPTSLSNEKLESLSGGRKRIILTYGVPAELEAIVPYDMSVLEGGYDTIAPVMRWQATNTTDHTMARTLSEARVEKVKFEVSVAGMRDVELENDHGKIDPSKPFHPFGPVPRKGSSFYIGAQETLRKNVTSANLLIDWHEPPSNFSDHYQAYPDDLLPKNEDFTAQFQILQNGQFVDLSSAAQPLFDPSDATKQHKIDSQSSRLASGKLGMVKFQRLFSRRVKQVKAELPYGRVIITRPASALRMKPALRFRSEMILPKRQQRAVLFSSIQKGFLRLRLNTSFRQEDYPGLFSDIVVHNSLPANTDKQKTLPKLPYIPEISSFQLGYTAKTDEVDPQTLSEPVFENRDIRLFHLDAFGQREEHSRIKEELGIKNSSVSLFPSHSAEGQLLLGIAGLKGDQSVSLLIQIENGTADPDSTKRDIRWSYLASNHWIEFKDQEILADETNGFLQSGIVRFLLPKKVKDSNTLLEPGLVWLRAEVATKVESTCRLVDVRPNAVPVKLINPAEADHLDAGLPAESIVKSAGSLRGIKEIIQPYPSVGGAAPERDSAFRKRVSERLRHKDRAVSAWDYENLVLQNFPRVFKAQALNHTNENLEPLPGAVTVVVLPDAQASEAASSLTPKVDAASIAEINALLRSRSVDTASVHTINPSFETVRLSFSVEFRPGHPFLSYREILRKDIQARLAPWAYGDSGQVDFGGQVYRSAMIAFIDSLPYVDYVTDFKLFHRRTGSSSEQAVQVARPAKLGAILTPNGTHDILPAS